MKVRKKANKVIKNVLDAINDKEPNTRITKEKMKNLVSKMELFNSLIK